MSFFLVFLFSLFSFFIHGIHCLTDKNSACNASYGINKTYRENHKNIGKYPPGPRRCTHHPRSLSGGGGRGVGAGGGRPPGGSGEGGVGWNRARGGPGGGGGKEGPRMRILKRPARGPLRPLFRPRGKEGDRGVTNHSFPREG